MGVARHASSALVFTVVLASSALVHCGAPQSTTAPTVAAPESSALPAPSDGNMSGGGPTSAKPDPEIALDAKSADKTIAVHVGQTIVLTLGTNPTTGYDWAVISAPPPLGEPTTELAPPESGGEGVGTKRRFVWKTTGPLGPSEQPLELGYRRSFEKGVPPLKTFRVMLKDAR